MPAVGLFLSEDPPGVWHPVSCLLEAVSLPAQPEQPSPMPPPASAAPRQSAAAAAAAAAGSTSTAAEAPAPGVVLRATAFAAAGAVACWHQGPADASLPISFAGANRVPAWQPTAAGFAVHFRGAFCPQLDLFAGGW